MLTVADRWWPRSSATYLVSVAVESVAVPAVESELEEPVLDEPVLESAVPVVSVTVESVVVVSPAPESLQAARPVDASRTVAAAATKRVLVLDM